MKAYTYSEARQKLATILKEVERNGAVRIRRRDGSSFVVKREPRTGSPLDIKGVNLGLNRREIVALVREGRRDVRSRRKR
jgi:antitoxin Phd